MFLLKILISSFLLLSISVPSARLKASESESPHKSKAFGARLSDKYLFNKSILNPGPLQRGKNSPPSGGDSLAGAGNPGVERVHSPVPRAAKNSGDVEEEWVQRYESNHLPSVDQANSICADKGGSIIVTGASYRSITGADMLTIKYDERGGILWSQRYNGNMNGYDEGVAVAVDSSGAVYVTGITAFSQHNYGIATVRYGVTGEISWVRNYLQAGDSIDVPVSLAIDPGGNVIVGGYSQTDDGSMEMLILKYDRMGDLLWMRKYDGIYHGDDYLFSLATDRSSNIVAGGASQVSETGSEMALLFYDSAGFLKWEDRIIQNPGGRDAVTSVAFSPAGDVCAAGYCGNVSLNYDYCTMRYDTAGNRQWIRTLDGESAGNDYGVCVQTGKNEEVYVTGSSFRGKSGYDFLTVAYDEPGNLLWNSTFGGVAGFDDFPVAMIFDKPSDRIFISGSANSLNGGASDYVTLCYESNGVLFWHTYYDDPANANDVPSAMAIDLMGNLYLTGSSEGGSSSYDYLTVKYPSPEAEGWPRRYNNGNGDNAVSAVIAEQGGDLVALGSDSSELIVVKFDSTGKFKWESTLAGGISRGLDMAVDPAGNIYVCGLTNFSGNNDFLTAKFDGGGALSWSRTYNGTANLNDTPAGLAVTPGGDVYVTGTSSGIGSQSDIVTIKYNNNGIEQWISRYNGTSNNRDSAQRIRVGRDGEICVAGTSVRLGSSYDFVVLKYDTAGGEKWRRFYNGTANGADILKDMAIDSSGDLYVTGRSNGDGTSGDYATLKINSGGEVVWISRYDGPASGVDDPISIAVDPGLCVIVSGISSTISSGYDMATVKYDSAGRLLWSRLFNNIEGRNDIPAALKTDAEGNIYIAGTSNFLASGDDIVCFRYSPTGYFDWSLKYDSYYGSGDRPKSIFLDHGGKYMYTGGMSLNSDGVADMLILKNTFAGSSDQLWPRRDDGPGISYDAAKVLKLFEEGELVVGGRTTTRIGTEDIFLSSYAPDGSLNWNITQMNGNGGDVNILDLARDRGGNINVVATNYNRSSPCDIGLYKFDRGGNLLWSENYDGPEHSFDFGSSIAVDSRSNVIVAGYSSGLVSYDFVILKYDSSGNLLWETMYDGESNKDDLAYGIAIDGEDCVIVTGLSTGSNTRSDFATVKISADGEILWVKRFDGAVSGEDRPVAVGTNAKNEIIVSGYSTGPDTSYDLVTIKYSSDGDQLFASSYGGISRSDQLSRSMAIDTGGDVVVVAQTRLKAGPYSDYLLVKYDTAGNLLWDYLYDGGSDLDDRPEVIISGADNSLYVTGKSMEDDLTYSISTIKLNPDGTLGWTAQFESVPGCDNEGKSLAVDPSGSVYVTGTSFTESWSIVPTIKYRQTPLGVVEPDEGTGATFALFQNYPNPFNSGTVIRFSLPRPDHVTLTVYNTLGQVVAPPLRKDCPSGLTEISFGGDGLPSGLYFYRLHGSRGNVSTKKMIHIK